MRPFIFPGVERVLRSVPFRLAFAVTLVALHVWTAISFAYDRFDGAPFNAAPNSPPVFHDVAHEAYPSNARRLIVSRWDAEHYVGLALRGYSQCPHYRALSPDEMRGTVCDASFYPGYPAMGWALHRVTGIPVDYALWEIALVFTVIAFFLWTDRVIIDTIGLGATYVSLLAVNFFPTACFLIFIETDSLALAGILAGFIALARRRYVLAALAIGFTGAIRIGGVCAEASFALAIAMWCITDPPRGPGAVRQWLGRAALVPLGAWGSFLVSGYQTVLFHDPLFYVHGHDASFHHSTHFSILFELKPEWIIHGIDNTRGDLLWVYALLVLFLMGHRMAMRRFPGPTQVYGYALVAFTYVVSAIGTADLWGFGGFSRYVIVCIPAFLAIGTLLARRPAALFAWLLACAWHSREVDLCLYLGHIGPEALKKCNKTQWIGR
jgi:hypothetical protein